jgi:hypothetical protein
VLYTHFTSVVVCDFIAMVIIHMNKRFFVIRIPRRRNVSSAMVSPSTLSDFSHADIFSQFAIQSSEATCSQQLWFEYVVKQ